MLLLWNCRGLGLTLAVHMLTDVVELPGVRVDLSGSYAHRRGEGDGPDTSIPS